MFHTKVCVASGTITTTSRQEGAMRWQQEQYTAAFDLYMKSCFTGKFSESHAQNGEESRQRFGSFLVNGTQIGFLFATLTLTRSTHLRTLLLCYWPIFKTRQNISTYFIRKLSITKCPFLTFHLVFKTIRPLCPILV